ncbi:hypothetical protein B0H14DRAFT_3126334 [Mycena olivaceomarginata]|nr:hypothetical protein B0H14DRAFT_3126334 [Mycena olivaceomarginata]
MSASNDIIDHYQHLKKQDVPKNLQNDKELAEKHSIDVPTPRLYFILHPWPVALSNLDSLGPKWPASDRVWKLERNQGFTQLVASGRAKNGKGSKDICQIKWIDWVLPPAASNVHGRPGNRHAVHRQWEHLRHRHRAVESLENILLNMVREAPVSLCIDSGEDELVNYAMETDTFSCRVSVVSVSSIQGVKRSELSAPTGCSRHQEFTGLFKIKQLKLPFPHENAAFILISLFAVFVANILECRAIGIVGAEVDDCVVALFAKSTGAWISWREWCLRASVTPYRTTFKSLAITAENVGARMRYCSGVSAGRSTSREVFLHFKLHIFPPERSTASEYGRHHVALRIPKRTPACLYNTQHIAQGHGYMMRDSRAGVRLRCAVSQPSTTPVAGIYKRRVASST